MSTDTVLFRLGAALGGIGFVLLFVEASRVIFSEVTLSGFQGLLPWIGLGLLIVGAVLLGIAVTGSGDSATTSDGLSLDDPS